MKIQKILSLVLCLCLLLSGGVLAEETVEALVAAPEFSEMTEEIAEEISVAAEAAAEEPAPVVLTPLAAAEILPGEGWEQGENDALIIPCAEEITFAWTPVEGAVSYRIETARISEAGTAEDVREVGEAVEARITLPAASYAGGWYAIGIVAQAEDGRTSLSRRVFRIQEEIDASDDEEIAEEVSVSNDEEIAEEITVSSEATALTITSYPQSVTVAEGQKATVTVEAVGDGLSYTWYTREANSDTYYKSSISGPTYSVVMNEARHGRRLICYVSDKYGNKIQCPTVMIKMKTPLEITAYPQSVTVAEGEKATVSVEAVGDGLSYTWYTREASSDTYYKSSISGPTYSVVMNAARNGRRLICYVSDKYGNKIQCPTVLIKMKASLAITQDIADVAVAEGEKATVTVKATGTGLSYKWYYKDAGASTFKLTTSFTGNTYSISMSAARAGRQVYCVVTDANGNSVTSATATLKMKTRLAITQDIADVGVNEGETARVTVKATGSGLTYAWYFKDPGAAKFSLTNSYKTASYSVSMTAERSGRQVYCIITDAYGESIQSATATLRVKTPLTVATDFSNSSAYEGEKVKLIVTAAGDGLTYTWYTQDANQTKFYKSSVTGNIYSVEMTAARDGRQVYCVVSDAYGNTMQTENVTLEMKASPFWYEVNSDGTLTITGYKGEIPANLTIPAQINGKAVTAIGSSAFSGCSSLTSITLGNVSIGYYAFKDCSSLTSVTLGNVSIGYYAFAGCSSLTSITINSGSIGDSAFGGCSSLTSLMIGSGVTSIGNSAFSSCRRLTSINIPDSVTSIGNSAFSYCSSLTSITIPDSVTSIGDWTFFECSSLTSITIPDSVTSIGSQAFSSCSSLTSITIPDSVTSIGSSAFSGCSSLTSVTIPDSVTSIGYSAFADCSSLTSITIPDSVTSIGDCFFQNCRRLTSITIPDSVTSIGIYAFWNCYSLASITIPNSVTSIGEFTFSNCYSLTSITIPDSVTSIGEHAFDSCRSLLSINIPDSVTSIGEYAFYGCDSLTSVTFGDSVTSIGDRTFYECSSLTSITIPDSVTSIGYMAFYECSSLTSVTLGSGITNIGDYAFWGCGRLTSITVPASVTSIGTSAFSKSYSNSIHLYVYSGSYAHEWCKKYHSNYTVI